MRVEQLSVRSDVSVDTIRYYQSKGLLDPPRREGRVAWYGRDHLDRLARIRTLQQRGFTLATIARVVSGELDAADEALIGELTGWHDGAGGRTPRPPPLRRDRPPGPTGDEPDPTLTLEELAEATGVPLALLKAVEAEGLLIPQPGPGPGPLHRRGRGRGPGRPAPVGVGHPPLGPVGSGPTPPRGHRGGGQGGGGHVLHPRPGPAATGPVRPAAPVGPTRSRTSNDSCRPTRSCSRPSTRWSATTSPGPWSPWPSTTSRRWAPTPNGRPSGTGPMPTCRGAWGPGARTTTRSRRHPGEGSPGPRRPWSTGWPTPTSPRVRRRRCWCARCSTPSPRATTWSIA